MKKNIKLFGEIPEQTHVKITSEVRRGKIGLYIGKRKTAIGERYLIEFEDGRSGLYGYDNFKLI